MVLNTAIVSRVIKYNPIFYSLIELLPSVLTIY